MKHRFPCRPFRLLYCNKRKRSDEKRLPTRLPYFRAVAAPVLCSPRLKFNVSCCIPSSSTAPSPSLVFQAASQKS
jgi:hypothetical protein